MLKIKLFERNDDLGWDYAGEVTLDEAADIEWANADGFQMAHVEVWHDDVQIFPDPANNHGSLVEQVQILERVVGSR